MFILRFVSNAEVMHGLK